MTDTDLVLAGQYICFDLGRRKVGVAAGDSQTGLARELCTLRFKPRIDTTQGKAAVTDQQIQIAIVALVAEQSAKIKVAGLVFGLPLGRQQQTNQQARWVSELATRVAVEVSLPYHFVNERLSSWAAREELAQQGYRTTQIDQLEDQYVAKCLLLEFFADQRQQTCP